jgi:hypothetical protein
MTRQSLHNVPWSSLDDVWSGPIPTPFDTISLRDDRLLAKQAASERTTHSAVASERLAWRGGPVTPSTHISCFPCRSLTSRPSHPVPAEHARKHAHGEEEARPAGDPAFAIVAPSAAMRGLWPWIERASRRLHRNMLAIALANKLARIAWAVLARGRAYQPRTAANAA